MPTTPAFDRPAAGPRVRTGDGVDLATWDLGGDGPPLLATHGTGLHSWMWLGTAPGLARTHHVWGLDLRGHGASGPSPDRTYSEWWDFAADVLAAVDALDLDRPAGVGHSLGAAALLMAELERPGTFSALWCWEPIVPPPSPDASASGRSLADLARRRRTHFDSVAAGVANFTGKRPFAAFTPAMLEAFVDHATVADPAGGVALVLPGTEEATAYDGAGRHGAWARLGQLDLPVTVAAGDDPGVSAWAPLVAGRIRGARFEAFPGLTHMGPAEDPLRVGRAVATALDPRRGVDGGGVAGIHGGGAGVGGAGSTDAVAPPR